MLGDLVGLFLLLTPESKGSGKFVGSEPDCFHGPRCIPHHEHHLCSIKDESHEHHHP